MHACVVSMSWRQALQVGSAEQTCRHPGKKTKNKHAWRKRGRREIGVTAAERHFQRCLPLVSLPTLPPLLPGWPKASRAALRPSACLRGAAALLHAERHEWSALLEGAPLPFWHSASSLLPHFFLALLLAPPLLAPPAGALRLAPAPTAGAASSLSQGASHSGADSALGSPDFTRNRLCPKPMATCSEGVGWQAAAAGV